MSWNTQVLVDDAISSSTRAVNFDNSGQFDVAAYYYREAARLLLLAASTGDQNQSQSAWKDKAKDYLERADVIDKLRFASAKQAAQSEEQRGLSRVRFFFHQALDADESGEETTAVELYMKAVELSISTNKGTSDVALQQKLTKLAKQALERAEVLKGVTNKSIETPLPTAPSPPTTPPTPRSVRTSGLKSIPEKDTNSSPTEEQRGPSSGPPPSSTPSRPQLHRGSSAHLVVAGQSSYTKEEKLVLEKTSRINNNEFVPFMSVDLREQFRLTMPYTDRSGHLALSPKQLKHFARWARPEEICAEPTMVAQGGVDCWSIKQTIVSDCSFVASLAIGALYERRFNKKIISSVIYPCNAKQDPVYNPFGKYMMKFHINGITRKVVIDDYLPVGKHGELLCSYSTNKNELWISLIEKAYMKIMGGYDFPGSNSNIDLHALTGWIPERVAIRPDEGSFNKDAFFNTLYQRLHRGDVLATVATGLLNQADADRSGLVPTHAYAVLDIKEVKGIRLFKLKNPWSHLRWRGNYSELDTRHWTEELKAILKFDPNSAAMFDNGVFWIDYDSICQFFDVFYLNWNTSIFKYTFCIHQSWKAGLGPIKDAYNISDNPQFSLEVQASSSPASVWILLTRHITQLEDFRENREYITVVVYKNDGKRVYYPYDPKPFIDGIRINSPHYLSKLTVPANTTERFTLVVSQYEKMNTIFYTLRAYSTNPFVLKKIGSPLEHKKEISGEWKSGQAGGCRNNRETCMQNPRYQLTLQGNNNNLLINLRGPKQYQIGLEVICVVTSDQNAPGAFKTKSSGDYRSGFVVLELESVPAGTYDIMVSTFMPNQHGPFILAVKSTTPFTLA